MSCPLCAIFSSSGTLTLYRGKDQSPPKREYKVSDPAVRNLSLVELDFAPSSLLMLQFEEESLNRMSRIASPASCSINNLILSTDENVPAPLDASVLAVIEDYPVPRTFEDAPTKDNKPDGGKPRSTFTFGKKDESGELKVPKWLKLGPSTRPSPTSCSHHQLTARHRIDCSGQTVARSHYIVH